jgi:hypothetical protein
MPHPADPTETFIRRWDGTERAERANYISFLNELCAVLAAQPPSPSSFRLGHDDTCSAPIENVKWQLLAPETKSVMVVPGGPASMVKAPNRAGRLDNVARPMAAAPCCGSTAEAEAAVHGATVEPV